MEKYFPHTSLFFSFFFKNNNKNLYEIILMKKRAAKKQSHTAREVFQRRLLAIRKRAISFFISVSDSEVHEQ